MTRYSHYNRLSAEGAHTQNFAIKESWKSTADFNESGQMKA